MLDAVYDMITKKVASLAHNAEMGNGLKEKNVLGTVQNWAQFDKVTRLVSDAEERGRRILARGTDHKKINGLFFRPTIVADAEDGDRLVDEEQFGSALPIIRFDNLDKVIERSNENPNGLGGSVWTKSRIGAREVALRVDCGSVWTNKHGSIQPNIPFGGVGQSGIGREFGEDGMLEYLDSKSVFLEG